MLKRLGVHTLPETFLLLKPFDHQPFSRRHIYFSYEPHHVQQPRIQEIRFSYLNQPYANFPLRFQG